MVVMRKKDEWSRQDKTWQENIERNFCSLGQRLESESAKFNHSFVVRKCLRNLRTKITSILAEIVGPPSKNHPTT